MNETEQQSLATEAVLEWIFFQLVSTSRNPSSLIADFNEHMKRRAAKMDEAADMLLLRGSAETFSEMREAASKTRALATTLHASIRVNCAKITALS